MDGKTNPPKLLLLFAFLLFCVVSTNAASLSSTGHNLGSDCTHEDGSVIPLGTDKFYTYEKSCTIVQCTKAGLNKLVAECVAPRCVDPIRKPGACCLSCPEGFNCRLPSGEILESSQTIISDTEVCRCPTITKGLGWDQDLINAECHPVTTTPAPTTPPPVTCTLPDGGILEEGGVRVEGREDAGCSRYECGSEGVVVMYGQCPQVRCPGTEGERRPGACCPTCPGDPDEASEPVDGYKTVPPASPTQETTTRKAPLFLLYLLLNAAFGNKSPFSRPGPHFSGSGQSSGGFGHPFGGFGHPPNGGYQPGHHHHHHHHSGDVKPNPGMGGEAGVGEPKPEEEAGGEEGKGHSWRRKHCPYHHGSHGRFGPGSGGMGGGFSHKFETKPQEQAGEMVLPPPDQEENASRKVLSLIMLAKMRAHNGEEGDPTTKLDWNAGDQDEEKEKKSWPFWKDRDSEEKEQKTWPDFKGWGSKSPSMEEGKDWKKFWAAKHGDAEEGKKTWPGRQDWPSKPSQGEEDKKVWIRKHGGDEEGRWGKFWAAKNGDGDGGKPDWPGKPEDVNGVREKWKEFWRGKNAGEKGERDGEKGEEEGEEGGGGSKMFWHSHDHHSNHPHPHPPNFPHHHHHHHHYPNSPSSHEHVDPHPPTTQQVENPIPKEPAMYRILPHPYPYQPPQGEAAPEAETEAGEGEETGAEGEDENPQAPGMFHILPYPYPYQPQEGEGEAREADAKAEAEAGEEVEWIDSDENQNESEDGFTDPSRRLTEEHWTTEIIYDGTTSYPVDPHSQGYTEENQPPKFRSPAPYPMVS